MKYGKLEVAKLIAEALHCNQKYGDKDYKWHLFDVVLVLTRFHVQDENLLISAYFHDSVEDTKLKLSFIKEHFGEQVSDLVYAVTDEGGINRKERALKTYPKMVGNKQAIILKLADRIANVENSIFTRNKEMWSMYNKEYSSFRHFLYDETNQGGTLNLMWHHLDGLLKEWRMDSKTVSAE